MFSFFKRDETFFDLLEASAAEVRLCASLLKDVAPHLGGDTSAQIELIHKSRRAHKKLAQQITERLCRTFITPLDREDIESLSSVLHRIPKAVEKVAERMAVCPPRFISDIISNQVSLLDQATDEVVLMVGGLRKKMSVEQVQVHQDRLQHIEGNGDKMLLNLLRGLFNEYQVEPMEVIILKDLYEILERAIDRCRDAGNVVFQMALKNS